MQFNPLARPSIDSLTGFGFVAAMTMFVSHYAIPGLSGVTNQPLHDLAVDALFTVLVIAPSIGIHIAVEPPARRAVRHLFSVRKVRGPDEANS
jgi:hypothetical protein